MCISTTRHLFYDEQTTEKGMYKMGGDKLRAYSKSRCTQTQDCIDLVKSLPARHVYLNVSFESS